jgi:hypothetical protein
MSIKTWNYFAVIIGGSLVFVLIIASGSLWPVLLFAIPALTTWGLLSLLKRTRPEEPPKPLPVPPLTDPGRLEGRVERMRVEDVEIEVDSWKPWETKRVASVYIIVISGLQYTLDPRPVMKGRYDWMREGAWVNATFDRKTRVVYDITQGMDPMRRRAGGFPE